MTSGFRLLLLSAAALAFCLPSGAEESPRLRPAVHPRRNVEEFPPVEARFVRMTILRTARLVEPCLDEFEIYGPDAPGENLALAEEGTRTRASGTLEAYRIHALKHVNDGLYGNARSWICDTVRDGWVELELPAPARIDRIVWSRDRQGKFIDRLPVDYRIEVALEPGEWHLVASSSGRTPLSAVASTNPGLPYDLDNSLRYSPWGLTAPAGEAPDPPRAAGREYVISTWNTTHGLPSNTVTALSQTRDAWLWVGTSNGLARFDGVHFTAYGENDGLPSLSVGALCNDALGGLWVGTLGGGLARWDGRRFRPVATGASAEARIVVSLAADADGTVWAATLDGLFECRGDAVVRHMGGQQIPDVACNRTQAGAWFYPLGDGLCHIADGKITKIDPTLERSLCSSLVALAAGQAGEVWFGGANRYVGRFADGEAMAFAETAALTSTVWEILPALCGDVWLGTSASGLLRLRDGAILSITTEDGLPSNGTPALCEDAEGNLWAGTTGGGLARLSPRRVDALTPGDGLSHRAVIALAEDADGAVWIGTNGGGLNRWHDGRVEPVSPSYVLENETIAALVPAAVADGGGLWISTAFSGLARLTGDGIEFVSTFGGNPGHAIGAFAADGAGGLWVGTQQGVFHFRDGEAAIPAGLEALANREITALMLDDSGALWIGTRGDGVARWAGSGNLRRWTPADGLPSAFIRTLQLDDGGTLWAGTNDGLCRWRGGTIDTFTSANGLPNSAVSQILDDGVGHLWLGTNRGVLRVARSSLDDVAAGRARLLEVLALDTADGLPSLECTTGLRRRDGRLCFGTSAGLAVIDPARFAPLPSAPIIIESVAVGEAAPRVPGTGPVVAEAGAGRVEIRFTAPSHTAPQRVRFRWRLEGLDTAWSEASADRVVSYRHLPPGEYRFRVAASREGGPWSEPGASIALLVPTPWWRSPWSAVAGLIAGAGLVAGVSRILVQRRMKRRLRRVEQAFAIESERSRIARDIHDTLGANLTQITIHSATGRTDCDKPETVTKHFDAISATAGDLVQSLDRIVWAVNPAHDTLESLARYLMRFAAEFCAASPVRLRLDVPGELPGIALRSEVRHNILLAAREALNNTIRHAGAAKVSLRLAVSHSVLRIDIEDDGRGFDPANADTGNGLANMRRRLDHCGGTCRVESKLGEGTSVVFSFPVSTEPSLCQPP